MRNFRKRRQEILEPAKIMVRPPEIPLPVIVPDVVITLRSKWWLLAAFALLTLLVNGLSLMFQS